MEAKEQEVAPESQIEDTAGTEELDDQASLATAATQDENEVPQAEAEPESESLEDQLARLQEERNSYLDGLQRSRADLDN